MDRIFIIVSFLILLNSLPSVFGNREDRMNAHHSSSLHVSAGIIRMSATTNVIFLRRIAILQWVEIRRIVWHHDQSMNYSVVFCNILRLNPEGIHGGIMERNCTNI